MFKDEINAVMKLENKIFPFVITMLGGENTYISGVKNVLLSTEEAIRLRFPGTVAEISGENLRIEAIGGGDVLLKGRVLDVKFE